MITGRVNAGLEATVRLSLRGSQGGETVVEAVVDTGFSGFLTLPPDLVEELGLKFHKRGQAVLGDGSTVVFDTYEAIILWNGRARRIAIDAAEVDPLLGVRLLYGHGLSVDFIENGDVVIQALPMS
ncbi:MAG TPA: clan AA aspartic protease [Thermoanaerobaculia bacterium]